MKRMLQGILALGMVASLAAAAAAEQTDYAIQSVGGVELKLPLGPRPVAMGEAFVGLADDLNATAWNPAGLTQIKGYQAGFMHSIYLQETSLEYLAYAQELFPGAGIGANLTYLNYGTLDKVNETAGGLPEIVGEFTPNTFTFTAGYGQSFGDALALGGALKFISQSIDTESYAAVALDAGMLLQPGVSGLKLGLAVQNLGTAMADSPLPMNAKAGAAYRMPAFADNDVWHLLLDVNVPFGDANYTSANLGTEYWINDVVAGRLGYKVKDTGELGGVTGLTAGLGVKLEMINLDYALVDFGDLGMTHQIAVGVSFD